MTMRTHDLHGKLGDPDPKPATAASQFPPLASPWKVWPADPHDGAWLMARMAHGLLTGLSAQAFLSPGALGQGVNFNAKGLMDTAEVLASEAMRRAFDRMNESGTILIGEIREAGTYDCPEEFRR